MWGDIQSYMAAIYASKYQLQMASSALQSGTDGFANPSGSHTKVTWVQAILALFDHCKPWATRCLWSISHDLPSLSSLTIINCYWQWLMIIDHDSPEYLHHECTASGSQMITRIINDPPTGELNHYPDEQRQTLEKTRLILHYKGRENLWMGQH